MIYGNWFVLYNGNLANDVSFANLESFDDLLVKGNCICAPTVCWRREFWAGYLKDIEPDKKNWFFEDYPLWLYIARHGKIKHLNRNFCVYRLNAESASVYTNPEKRLKIRADVYEVQLLFAEKYAPQYLPEIARKILENEGLSQ